MRISLTYLALLAFFGLTACMKMPSSSADEMTELISSIESVTFVPGPQGGDVEIVGNTELQFRISPLGAGEELMGADIGYMTVTAEYCETKSAARIKYIPIVSRSFSDGLLSLVIDGDVLPEEFFGGEISANLTLNISDGIAKASSNPVPVLYRPGGNTLSSFFVSNGEIMEEGIFYGNNIVVILPGGSSLKNLVASYTTDARDVFVDGVPQSNGLSANDFTKTVTYTVSSKNAQARKYFVRAYSFDLPAVLVGTPENISINSKEIWVEGTKISIHNTDRTIDELGTAGIKGRGNTTWALYDKKPYAISLDKKSKVLGMPKDKKWNLIANFIDRTNIRNAVTLELARRTKFLEWTPRGEFVELVMNGTHQGLYYLCEKIKISKNRLNITELTPDVVSGDALTGGYLLEFDQNYDEFYKFHSSRKHFPINLKAPDEDVPDVQLEYISSYINEIEWQLYHYDPAACSYKDLLDIDTFIDYWFVQEVSGNYGCNGPKSVYMYKDVNEKLKAGPCWDFDWGTYMPEKVTEWRAKTVGLWYPRMFKDPAFVARVKEKWAESKPDFLDIKNYVDSLSAVIKTSAEVDNAMWPLAKYKINGDENLSYDESIERMKSYIDERIEWLDASISAL